MFVSSTFQDMHAERDYLNRIVWPELRSRSLRRGVEFVAIDLRWGVTGEDTGQRGAVAICLQEIERCDFVIGLIGNRYGWIPAEDQLPTELLAKSVPFDATGVSVTELEVRHALATLPPRRTLVYLRDADVTSGARFASAFSETDPARRERLAALRKAIRGHAGVLSRTYNATFEGIRVAPGLLPDTLTSGERRLLDDGVIRLEELARAGPTLKRLVNEYGTPALGGLEAWGTQVQEDLWTAIEQDFPFVERADSSEAGNRSSHEQFLVERTALFVGRDAVIGRVLASVGDNEAKPLLVIGDPGSGKSALLAECARRLREQHPDALVVPYFIGGAPGSTSPAAMVRSLCAALQGARGFSGEIPAEPTELFRTFGRFVEHAGDGGPVILVLDALNQLDADADGSKLAWLPPRWPASVRVILSSARSDEAHALAARLPADQVLSLEPLADAERTMLVAELLARRGKRLTQDQLARLLDAAQRPDAGLPLYITVAIEELSLFGHYDALDARIDRLPPTITALFDQVLLRVDQDHGRPLAEQVLQLLAASRSGMLESEILDLLESAEPGFARVRWVRLYRSLEFYLRRVDEASGGGLLGFFHEQLREAVFRRCFGMASVSAPPTTALKKVHARLADYFGATAHSADDAAEWDVLRPRSLRELPYHLARCARWPALRQVLTEFGFLQASVTALGPQALIEHYALALAASPAYPAAVVRALRVLQSTLRQSAYALTQDVNQLAPQLLGRLRGAVLADLRRVVDQAVEWRGASWLRPRTASLAAAGAALERVLIGREAGEYVAVTPDGRRVIASSARTLAVWDAATGRMERELARDYQQAFALSHDGSRIAIAGPPGTLQILDVQSGAVLRTLEGQMRKLSAAAFTPDGNRLVAGDTATDATEQMNAVLLVWDVATGALLHRMTGHRGYGVRDLAITPDGSRVVSVGEERTGRVWSLQTGQLLHELPHDYIVVTAVAIMPDGECALAATATGSFTIWDLETGKSLKTFKCPQERTTRVTPYAYALVLPAAGTRGVFAMMDETLRMWNMKSQRFEQTLTGHADEVLDVASTPDGALVVSASRDRTVRIWRPGQRTEVTPPPGHDSRITGLAVTPDGSRTISASWDHTIRIWETSTGAEVSKIAGHGESVNAVLVTSDGQRLVSSSSDRTVRVWRLRDGREGRSLRGGSTNGEWPTERLVVLTPDGKHIVNAAGSGSIAMHRIASGATVWTHQGEWLPEYVAVTPDGRHAIFCSDLPHVLVLDARTGVIVHRLRAVGQKAEIAAATPDSEHAVVGYGNGSVRIWSLSTGTVARTFRGHKEVVCALDVTADGRFAVSGDRSGVVKVWDIAGGKEHATLRGHTSRIWMLALSPDSRRAATASDDHTLRAWDVEAGKQVAALLDEGAVWSCAFVSDSRTMVAGGDSGRVHFLELIEP